MGMCWPEAAFEATPRSQRTPLLGIYTLPTFLNHRTFADEGPMIFKDHAEEILVKSPQLAWTMSCVSQGSELTLTMRACRVEEVVHGSRQGNDRHISTSRLDDAVVGSRQPSWITLL